MAISTFDLISEQQYILAREVGSILDRNSWVSQSILSVVVRTHFPRPLPIDVFSPSHRANKNVRTAAVAVVPFFWLLIHPTIQLSLVLPVKN